MCEIPTIFVHKPHGRHLRPRIVRRLLRCFDGRIVEVIETHPLMEFASNLLAFIASPSVTERYWSPPRRCHVWLQCSITETAVVDMPEENHEHAGHHHGHAH